MALALVSLGLTACLDSTVPDYATVEGTTFASSLEVDLANSTGTPTGVYYRDLAVGTGDAIAEGQDMYMFYEAYLSNGTKVDERQPPDIPLTFTAGTAAITPGLEFGMQGMRVGGRRQVIVPPNLAYGMDDIRNNSTGEVIIPGNSVLVFVVELVNADGSPGPTTTTP